MVLVTSEGLYSPKVSRTHLYLVMNIELNLHVAVCCISNAAMLPVTFYWSCMCDELHVATCVQCGVANRDKHMMAEHHFKSKWD